MKCAVLAISMSCLVPVLCQAKAPPAPTYPAAWAPTDQVQPERQVRAHRITHRRTRPSRLDHNGRATPAPSQSVALLQADIAALRRELASVRAEIGVERPQKPLLGWTSALYPPTLAGNRPVEAVETPNLSSLGAPSLPMDPTPLPFSGRLEGVADEVRIARGYLASTATIGLTMARQGVEIALGRLHPDFAVKLAAAIKRAREAGLAHCGIFSAYRPPAFGVGGFSDKFNSLHSYGLAADVTGIGGPGSRHAHLWERIVRQVGLFLPYGANNRAEFNHTQLLSTRVAARQLRGTITSSAPKDLFKMWLASGVTAHVPEAAAIPIASSKLLPEMDWAQ